MTISPPVIGIQDEVQHSPDRRGVSPGADGTASSVICQIVWHSSSTLNGTFLVRTYIATLARLARFAGQRSDERDLSAATVPYSVVVGSGAGAVAWSWL